MTTDNSNRRNVGSCCGGNGNGNGNDRADYARQNNGGKEEEIVGRTSVSSSNRGNIRVRLFASGFLSFGSCDDNDDDDDDNDMPAVVELDNQKSRLHREATASRSIDGSTMMMMMMMMDSDDDFDNESDLGSCSADLETTTETTKRNDDREIIEAVLQQLSVDEVETAARVSYQYCTQLSSHPHHNIYYARRLIQRHISDHSVLKKGRKDHDTVIVAIVQATLQKVRTTLSFYRDKRIHETVRTLLFDNHHHHHHHHPNHHNDLHEKHKRILTDYLGPKGKMFVRGHDKQGHACVHVICRHSPPHSHNDREGAMLSFFYTLERAIACSKHGHERVVGCMDLQGFQLWHLPPLHVMVELLLLLKNMYRERLVRIYLVDAPVLARYMWKMLQPFLYQKIREKCIFVTGEKQRRDIFATNFDLDQCMSYQHPEGKLPETIDMDAYLCQPFDTAYGDMDDEKTNDGCLRRQLGLD